jgi:hypothetical protein
MSVSLSIIAAGRTFEYRGRVGVRSILSGTQDETLQAMAERHADYQARVGRQGHQNWNRRFQELVRALPGYTNIQEIAAESWPDKSGEDEAAWEMFNSWRQSPGHWSVANGECAIWGYAMAFCQRKTTWYAAGCCADRRGWGAVPGELAKQTGRCLGVLPKPKHRPMG